MEITREIAEKVLDVVDAGLVRGLGKAEKGKMCVEAAVCFALGEKFSDEPSCVSRAVSAFKIRLNDSNWSSNEARTKGMRKLAIAQLGSDSINQVEFGKIVTLGIIKEVLPIVLRVHGLEKEALGCEKAETLEEAKAAANAAKAANAANAAAYAAYAADAANAANAAAYAAYAAYAADAAYAAAYAAYAAAYAADAAAYAAYAAAYAAYAAADNILTKAAETALKALIELKSPGCEFLALCD